MFLQGEGFALLLLHKLITPASGLSSAQVTETGHWALSSDPCVNLTP